MILDLKKIMVDVSKIEVITPYLNKYESNGCCEYKIQVSGQVYRIEEKDYPRNLLIMQWKGDLK